MSCVVFGVPLLALPGAAPEFEAGPSHVNNGSFDGMETVFRKLSPNLNPNSETVGLLWSSSIFDKTEGAACASAELQLAIKKSAVARFRFAQLEE